MTVAYSLDVATSSIFTQFWVLFRWKGSVWKAVWAEWLLWIIMYAVISIIYRVLLNEHQREEFEKLCTFFDTFSVFIPVTFMLGFYVSIVYNRWTRVYENVGWIDTPALTIAEYVRGSSERARLLRRNCVRYLIVAQTMVFRDVSPAIRKRFPTMQHLVNAGLLRADELDEMNSVVSNQSKYWQPISWVFSMIRIAKEEGMIADYYLYVDVIEKVRQFRTMILKLVIYDMAPIPLVYTQVVTLAVRAYFLLALFGRQFLDMKQDLGTKYKYDIYFPVMTSLQIIFILGWLKVSEVMLNPLGEDDEDFETNWIIERNLQTGYTIVDQGYGRYPEIKRDPFWEEEEPQPMDPPSSHRRDTSHMRGSCIAMDKVPQSLFGSRRPSDDCSITTDTTNQSHYLPHGLSKGILRRRISNAFTRSRKSSKKERRSSVCLAALEMNHRSYSMNDVERMKTPSPGIVTPPPALEQDESTNQNVKWFVQEMPVIHEEDSQASIHRSQS